MAFKQNQVEDVRDKLDRAITLNAQVALLKDLTKIPRGDNDDLSIEGAQLISDYIASLKQKRDNLIAQIQPIVAAWIP